MAKYMTKGYGNHLTGPLGSLKINQVSHATKKKQIKNNAR